MLSGVAVGALVGPGCSFSCFLGFEPLSPGVNRGLVHGVACGSMVGVFDGISFGAWFLRDVKLKWALVFSFRVKVTENGGGWGAVVGVFDGISFDALNSVDLALEWALVGVAIGDLLGKRAVSANWVAGGAVVGLVDENPFSPLCLLDLDLKWALGGSLIGALLGIGAILPLVGYRWDMSTLGGVASVC
jgi:hypothetical protein